MKKVILLTVTVLLMSCASTRKKTKLTRPDGTKIACFQPPKDVMTENLEASIEAKIPYVKEQLDASLSVENKTKRIRDEISGINSVEVLEFKMCVAYGNGIINSQEYNEFFSQILPLLKNTNEN
nr:hypothetical protein [uncultured Allomuricauda sp.]